MASQGALAARRGTVLDRLAVLAERVNAQSATPLPVPSYSKVPEIANIERLEYIASLLERVVNGVLPDAMPVPPPQPTAAEEQLAVTTEIAADLFSQVQEVQTDAPPTGGLTPAHEQSAPVRPAQTAHATGGHPARQTRRGAR